MDTLRHQGNKGEVVIRILCFVAGIILMVFLNPSKTIVEEKLRMDTIFVRTPPEIIFLKAPRPLYLRDTVIEQVVYPINRFGGVEATKWGEIKWEAEASGFLNNLKLEPSFNMPVVTIEKTRTVYGKGMYAGAGINTFLQPSVGAAYQTKDWILDYNYNFSGIHHVGIKRKIF